ncbi:RNA polymerase sigma factor [Acetobacter vaccinii]|uniref:RNA polymerase sigma factor n=1 Tax=Acetobacter vaccinii TaxID=2592655 RepID=A0A5C1YSK9_9PROT|nr:RNA polymerase sigma factor [Acetobacter vaccinii]QEO17947.1 RNA polymerase sigma factor [Acetobacter vaccinii]
MNSNVTLLTELLLKERPSLLRLIKRIVGSVTDAEDLTQTLWLRIQSVTDSPPIENKQAYLYRLARNVALDRLRAFDRHNAVFEAAPLLDEVVAPLPSAETHLIDRENLEILLQAIEGLPPRCREVFILRKVENLKISEISEHLGMSSSMVARHLQHALTHCMARLKETGVP